MLQSKPKTPSELKIPNEIFEKITRSLKKLNSFFESVKVIMDSPNFVVPQTLQDDTQAIIDNLFEPLTTEEDIKFFDEYFTKGDDAIWQQASKEDREVWNQLKPLSIYLKSKASADHGIARNMNLGTKELVSLCIILTNSAKVHNTNPLTSNLFVYLSKQLVKDFHTGRLASEERGFDSDQQYKVCLAYLISVIGISMFSMVLYGYTFSILIKSIFIFSSLLGLISSQTFISDLQIYDKSIDAKHLFLYFNTLFFIISLLAIIAFKSPILLTFCFIASLTPLGAHFYTNPIIKTFIREQPVNEQELNLLNIMLLDNIKDECSDEYFDTLANPLDLMGLKRAWVPYCSLQKFEQDFKYDFYQQTFEYLKELGVVQGEQLRNRSSISPTEAKGKYEFKKHIQDCRCQLQSMFRVNKSSQSLEVITELPTNRI